MKSPSYLIYDLDLVLEIYVTGIFYGATIIKLIIKHKSSRNPILGPAAFFKLIRD